jgi:hypothetical protein
MEQALDLIGVEAQRPASGAAYVEIGDRRAYSEFVDEALRTRQAAAA